MGRPEPGVLFAQSFVHAQLDEYVDEVIFTEPVVITACEILEQNASASCPVVSLSGASWPQSFALEFFVQSEGESRFRRLCQAFLYSPSSSNTLDVQSIVTNHLVIRGSYRVLSLVIYGNTAEELGQFNVELDLDNSLATLTQNASDGNIEDLPFPLQLVKPTLQESIFPLHHFHLVKSTFAEVKDILFWSSEICKLNLDQTNAQKLIRLLLSAATAFVSIDYSSSSMTFGNTKSAGNALAEVKHELSDLYKRLVYKGDDLQALDLDEKPKFERSEVTSEDNTVIYAFQQWFDLDKRVSIPGISILNEKDAVTGGLITMQLVCINLDGCSFFLKQNGLQYVVDILKRESGVSVATTLMALAVVEHVCRYALGCDKVLEWSSHDSESIKSDACEIYQTVLQSLMKDEEHGIKQHDIARHDVACHARQILQRLNAFSSLISFESIVTPMLKSLHCQHDDPLQILPSHYSDRLILKSMVDAHEELTKLLKFLKSRDPIDDPSPVAHAQKAILVDHEDGVLPYKATIGLIRSSKYRIVQKDIDPYFLSVLKERKFLSLLVSFLSFPTIGKKISSKKTIMDAFINVITTIEDMLLSFLCCRSGLLFLLSDPDAVKGLILTLSGTEKKRKEEFLSVRYASVLISKGLFCPPKDIGAIMKWSLKVVCAIDRVIGATFHSEELLRALWDLCSISRSDVGRQAVLAMSMFPEVISILIEILKYGKESELGASSISTWPLSLAIFHAAAELFEVMVTDSTACSLCAWVPHALDLHKALHTLSLGSNKKDAPARLLDWVDAAFVYCKKGVIGLLRYAGLLASGSDAQLTSTSFLASEITEIDNGTGDSNGVADFQSVEILLGKLISDKLYHGIILSDPSIPRLTTAMRILAFVAEYPGVAAGLYEEGAVTVLYAIIMNCALMLERSSNQYDYLVDDGAECNSTADLLLERSREHQIVETLLPSLVLLLNLLRKLQEAGEQHHNTRLLNALLRLHREISPKLASRTADLLFTYPSSTLALGAVSHLLVSCLACWPAFGWTPGLFQCLLENVPTPTTLALGPKEACSVLALLGDLFPEEGTWLWKNGSSSLNALKTLGIGTRLGLKSFDDVDWYLTKPHFEKLLNRLVPHFDKIAQIVLHFSCTALRVLQDMLRVMIIRIACKRNESAVILLRPLLAWIQECITLNAPSDVEIFKLERLTEFLAGLLEHPSTKRILIKEDIVDLLIRLLDKIIKNLKLSGTSEKNSSSILLQLCSFIFRSFSLLCDPNISVEPLAILSRRLADCPSFEGFCRIILNLLKCCDVILVGKELQACWEALTSVGSHKLGRSAFAFVALQFITANEEKTVEAEKISSLIADELYCQPVRPFMSCWQKLIAAVENNEESINEAIEIVKQFSLCCLFLGEAGKSKYGLVALKNLFGLDNNLEGSTRETLENISKMVEVLDIKIKLASVDPSSDMVDSLEKAMVVVNHMLRLLAKKVPEIKMVELVPKSETSPIEASLEGSWRKLSPHLSLNAEVLLRTENESAASNENIKELGENMTEDLYFGRHLADRFLWECPDSSERATAVVGTSLKRKAATSDVPSRRQRVEGGPAGTGAEAAGSNQFTRPGGLTPAAQTRNTFRNRKPNSSRPASTHVDDYVARERNTNEGAGVSGTASNAGRGGMTSGRPPSVHVDEFMARERERLQNANASAAASQTSVTEPAASQTSQPQSQPQAQPQPQPEADTAADRCRRPRNIRSHLDDDLQEINIELDVPTSEDMLINFPQTDDVLQPAAAVVRIPELISPEPTAEDDTDYDTNVVHPPRPGTSGTQVNLESSRGEANFDHSREAAVPPKDQHEYRAPNVASMASGGGVYEAAKRSGAALHLGYQAGELDSVPLTLLPSAQSVSDQSGIPQSPFDQRGPGPGPVPVPVSVPPPLPRFPTPTSAMHAGSSGYSSGYQQQHHPPPLPSGPPFQSHDSHMPTSKDYYGEGISGNIATQHLGPTGARATLETSPRTYPPPKFHNDPPRAAAAGFVSPASATPPRPPFDPSTTAKNSAVPWYAPTSSSRSTDDAISSARQQQQQPPLPPTPPPFSNQGGFQASSKSSMPGISMQPGPTTGSFANANQTNTRSHNPLSSSSFIPPLPQGTPPGNVLGRGQPQNQQQAHTNPQHISMNLQSQQQQTTSQPQPPPPPPPPPPHPHLQQSHQLAGQRSQAQSITSISQPTGQFNQQASIMQQNYVPHAAQSPGLQQQQAQASYYQQAQHAPSQYQQSFQQQESSTSGLQNFLSPEAIQNLLRNPDRLRELLEQHPKLMQMIQERLRESQ